MVAQAIINKQLKAIGFNINGWGRSEARELKHILLPDEEILECVNGIYEGGFAMMLATDVRALLVDKKPLNYLTVEDMRFDMISEIDYNHRLFGAYIKISAGETHLKFSSINQPRLRKLIGHVQFSMAESKKKQSSHQEGQNQHLEQINHRLQSYLLAQHQQQQRLHEQLRSVQGNQPAAVQLPALPPEPIRPDPELADYLFAQSLLAEHEARTGEKIQLTEEPPKPPVEELAPATVPVTAKPVKDELVDLYAEGLQEIFGKQDTQRVDTKKLGHHTLPHALASIHGPLEDEVNALKLAYSKLPMAMRNRKFGRPSFHAHSQDPAAIEPIEA